MYILERADIADVGQGWYAISKAGKWSVQKEFKNQISMSHIVCNHHVCLTELWRTVFISSSWRLWWQFLIWWGLIKVCKIMSYLFSYDACIKMSRLQIMFWIGKKLSSHFLFRDACSDSSHGADTSASALLQLLYLNLIMGSGSDCSQELSNIWLNVSMFRQPRGTRICLYC